MFDDVSDCCGFSDIDISQGSVAAFEMCWDILLSLCWKFTAKSVGESILKIDQHSTESYQNLVALFPDMVKNLPSPSPSKKSERIDTTAQFCCSDVDVGEHIGYRIRVCDTLVGVAVVHYKMQLGNVLYGGLQHTSELHLSRR